MTNTETNDNPAAVAERAANLAPEKATLMKGPRPKKGAAKAKKNANAAAAKKSAKPKKNAPKKERKTATPARESKGSMILDMIRRPKGASLSEIMQATGWQPHSVRGFISTAGKKGAKIESAKNSAGERVYTQSK